MRTIATHHAPTTLAADRRFGRFKKEDPHEVRQADVTGQSYAEQARKARQMLRSMDPEKVKQVIEFHRDLNFFQALALAKQEGRLIVPNDVHDRILTETKDPEERSSLGDRDFNRSREICSTEQTDRDRRSRDEQYLRQNYPVWTGTLVIYEKPNAPFGEKVVFEGITFIFPEQFRGKINCALVVEHPDFELVDRELVASSRPTNPSGFVVHFSSPRKIGDLPNGQTELGNNGYELKVADEKIHQIERFAKEDGWHLTEHGIPVGEKVNHSNISRFLFRNHGAYLGLLRRGDYCLDDNRRFVDLNDYPFYRCGVAFVQLASSEV